LITSLNRLRQEHPALQSLRTIRFHDTANDQIIAYSKTAGEDRLLMVVSLNFTETQEGHLHLNYDALGLDHTKQIHVRDQLSGQEWTWGTEAYLNLYPAHPAHILVITQP
jgi:starch synthase (maltosyl-transferring)